MIIAQKKLTVKGKIVKKGDEVVGVDNQEIEALLRAGIVVEKKVKDK